MAAYTMLGSRLAKSLLSRPNQYPDVDEDSDPDVFTTPLAEESEALLSRDVLTSCARTDSHDPDDRAEIALNTERTQDHDSSINSVESRQTAFRVGHDNIGSHNGVKTPQSIPTIVFPAMFPASQMVRRSLRRSASNPGPETNKSPHHHSTTDPTTLQKRLISQTKQTERPSTKPWRGHHLQPIVGPPQSANLQSRKKPGFRWYPLRSSSDSSTTPQTSYEANKVGKDLPLKPCMKGKSKSAAATPPDENHDKGEPQKLRRVKTVDFEDNVSRKLLALPPLKLWTADSVLETTASVNRSRDREGKSRLKPSKVTSLRTSCPGPKTKGTPAHAAVTRTDVHVVAIAPSWDIGDQPDESVIHPATPTMQIVESKSGCYEIIWDNVPLEHSIKLHQRGSSASQALVAASPESSRGPHELERVNTKLTEWNFSAGNPRELFKPQNVVFPDDDGRTLQFECAVENEGFIVIAPPNSERTSTNPSRHHSRPTSSHRTKSNSLASDETKSDEDTFEKDGYKQNELIVPDPDTSISRPGHLLGTHQRMRKPPSIRRFSNMEDFDVKFRDHRDSVALARNRILNVNHASPEHFVSSMPTASSLSSHRDSVTLARKRMHTHNRNHAISSARPSLKSIAMASEPTLRTNDLEDSLALLEKMAETETNSSPNLMLLSQPASAKHIRIVE